MSRLHICSWLCLGLMGAGAATGGEQSREADPQAAPLAVELGTIDGRVPGQLAYNAATESVLVLVTEVRDWQSLLLRIDAQGNVTKTKLAPLDSETTSYGTVISRNGRWIAGDVDIPGDAPQPAVMWRASAPDDPIRLDLPPVDAVRWPKIIAALNDGSAIGYVGGDVQVPVRWNAAHVPQLMPLPEGVEDVKVTDASNDGTVVVGASGEPGQDRVAVRWIGNDVEIIDDPDDLASVASAVSPDGSMIGLSRLDYQTDDEPDAVAALLMTEGEVVPITHADGSPVAGRVTAIAADGLVAVYSKERDGGSLFYVWRPGWPHALPLHRFLKQHAAGSLPVPLDPETLLFDVEHSGEQYHFLLIAGRRILYLRVPGEDHP